VNGEATIKVYYKRARHIEHLTALAIAINRRHKIHDARFAVVGLP